MLPLSYEARMGLDNIHLRFHMAALKASVTARRASEELQLIQEGCEHPAPFLDKSAGSSTGNYDPGADCYWYDFHCHICGKRWRVDQ